MGFTTPIDPDEINARMPNLPVDDRLSPAPPEIKIWAIADTVRMLADLNPDYCYLPENDNSDKARCVYGPTNRNPMGCLIGWAARYNGVDLSVFDEAQGGCDGAADDLSKALKFWPTYSSDVSRKLRWLDRVQGHQDYGTPWGEAVDLADKEELVGGVE